MDAIFLWPTWFIVAVLLAAMFAANEAGYLLGRRPLRSPSEASRSTSNMLKASIFGLVGFLLAFSFSATSSRHDARRRVVLEEANAIGTCYLRADLLNAPDGQRIRHVLRDLVSTRLDYFTNAKDPIVAARAVQDLNRLEDELWIAVETTVRTDQQLAHTSQIIPAANAVIDLNSTREWVTASHLQPVVLGVLILGVIVSSLLVGHSSGEAGQRHTGMWIAFNLLFGLVLYVLLDFDRPRRGLIQVNHAPLIELFETMQQSSPVADQHVVPATP